MRIIDFSPTYNNDVIKLQGQLIALFGAPSYTSKDLEDAYCYILEAAGSDGDEHVISVYDGSSGPAIGGSRNALKAAQYLKELLKDITPSDYDYEGYYFDTSTIIRRGIVGGKIFYTEKEISFEESQKVYEELYSGRFK